MKDVELGVDVMCCRQQQGQEDGKIEKKEKR